MGWEKIFVSHISGKGFIFKIYRFIKLKSKKSIKKIGKEMNRRFSKEDIQMTNKYMKRCSTLLIIRKMQIKHNKISPHFC